MDHNRKLLGLLVIAFMVSMFSCKSTDQSNAQSTGAEVKELTPADLAQLRDEHKLDPDAAIVSGKVVELTGENNNFILELEKLEKKGFGFSNFLKNGDKLTVLGGKRGEGLKKGQQVLIVVTAVKSPGVDDRFTLEKILANVSGK